MRNGPKLAFQERGDVGGDPQSSAAASLGRTAATAGVFWPSAAFSLSKTRNVAKLTLETSSCPSVISGFTGSGLSAVFRVKVRFRVRHGELQIWGTLAE